MLCLKIAGWVANSVDPDETPRSAASHLGLNCLLRPVCPNIYGKYGIYFFSIRHVKAILWKCLCKAITMSGPEHIFFLRNKKNWILPVSTFSTSLRYLPLKKESWNYLPSRCILSAYSWNVQRLSAWTLHVFAEWSGSMYSSCIFEDGFMRHVYTKHIRNDTGHQVSFIPNYCICPKY